MSRGVTPLVSAARMNQIDQQTQTDFHIPAIVLMENAGARAWALLRDRYLDPASRGRILFAVGKGNNGGDALVMARHAAVQRVHQPTVLLTTSDLREPGAGHLRACAALGIEVIDWRSMRERAIEAIDAADWIIDGIAGTGIRGALRGDAAELVEQINSSARPVAAIDCPSGIGDEYQPYFPALRARVTITIGLPKRCLYFPQARILAGAIEVLPIGFPPVLLDDSAAEWRLLDDGALAALLPPVERAAYKNQRGVVAVFAGAHGTSGAAVLCSSAAARCGAGMVRLYADRSIYPLVASQLVSVMTVGCDEREAVIPEGASALAIGPGWGRAEGRKQQLLALLRSGLPGVIDADGIAVLAELQAAGALSGAGGLEGRWVLTPHPGEFAALCGIERKQLPQNPAALLQQWAGELNVVIVLKGHVNYIARPDGGISVVDGMNPALATGGSGDVLAGMVAALLGRRMESAAAAEAAVLLHQRAGARLRRERGFFLAEELPKVVSALLAECSENDE